MMDWGLFALFAVILCLVFLAFHAWRGIKSEYDRIDAHRRQIDGKVLELAAEIRLACTNAAEARELAKTVEGTHYKHLLRRIDEAEASALGVMKQAEVLAEKIASMGGRMSALQRWMKREEPDQEEEIPANQIPMFPPVAPPAAGNATPPGVGRQFGRKVV